MILPLLFVLLAGILFCKNVTLQLQLDTTLPKCNAEDSKQVAFSNYQLVLTKLQYNGIATTVALEECASKELRRMFAPLYSVSVYKRVEQSLMFRVRIKKDANDTELRRIVKSAARYQINSIQSQLQSEKQVYTEKLGAQVALQFKEYAKEYSWKVVVFSILEHGDEILLVVE